jgi:hypothetical protein
MRFCSRSVLLSLSTLIRTSCGLRLLRKRTRASMLYWQINLKLCSRNPLRWWSNSSPNWQSVILARICLRIAWRRGLQFPRLACYLWRRTLQISSWCSSEFQLPFTSGSWFLLDLHRKVRTISRILWWLALLGVESQCCLPCLKGILISFRCLFTPSFRMLI